MSVSHSVHKVNKQMTLSDLVGKYNQNCLDQVASMYFEKKHYLNSEFNCRRHVLKPSCDLKLDNFFSFCKKEGFPISQADFKLNGEYAFSSKTSLDYSFVSDLEDNQVYQFPELTHLLSLLSFDSNCQAILALLKTYFEKRIDGLTDVQADFFEEIVVNIPSSFKTYEIWNDFVENESIVNEVKLEFIKLLVQHHPHIRLYFRLVKNEEEIEEVMYDKAVIDVDPIYEKFILLSHGGRQTFETLLGHHFDMEKCDSYQLFFGLFIYNQEQKEEKGHIWLNKDEMTQFGDDYITQNQIETAEWTNTFLYDENELVWSQMIEGPVFPRYLMFLNTFRQFLYEAIKPEDRDRFCFAGSMVKAFYKIRDVQDIDFLVSDTNGKIEKYGRFAPKLGSNIKGVMDDFGRTYYAIEKFYFPMIPDLYKKQTNTKVAQRKEDIPDDLPTGLITNLVPKYSASGLKAGRYIDIYSRQINCFLKEMCLDRPKVSSLDDILFYPEHHLSVGGIKFIPLEYEVIRDHMKDLDLKRVSHKQMMDFCEINKHYSSQQENPSVWSKLLGIENFSFEKANLITNAPCSFLEWNLYHGDLLEEKYFEVLIRRSPLDLNQSIQNMIKDGLLETITKAEMPSVKTSLHLKKTSKGKELTAVVHTSNDWINNQRFISSVLVTSIPSQIKYFKPDGSCEVFPSIWNFTINQKGQLNISLISNPYELGSWTPSFVREKEKIVSAGQIKIIEDDTSKQIHFNLSSPNVMSPILKRYNKDYENSVYHFTKSVFQLHRLFDTLVSKTITIHYETKSFTADCHISNHSGFTNRIFKTTNVETMKAWQEQTKKEISDPLPLQEYFKQTISS